MKALKWLVIVLACSCPPCFWSACDEPTNTCQTYDCHRFYAAVDYELWTCAKAWDSLKEQQKGWEDMRDQCLAMVEQGTCASLDEYQECIETSIGCDLEKGEVVVWGACFEVIGK